MNRQAKAGVLDRMFQKLQEKQLIRSDYPQRASVAVRPCMVCGNFL
ncbi:MAG TPA: hypothetical protein VGM84_24775 [Steroidobacteraceae bacterium]